MGRFSLWYTCFMIEKIRGTTAKRAFGHFLDWLLSGEEFEQGFGFPPKRESVEYTGPRYDDPELLAEIGARIGTRSAASLSSQVEVVPVEQ
jgi:hypothetical protein